MQQRSTGEWQCADWSLSASKTSNQMRNQYKQIAFSKRTDFLINW